MNNNTLEILAAAFGCTVEEIKKMANSVEQLAELARVAEDTIQQLKKCQAQMCRVDYDDIAELKREQREFGRSRLAQFGKTFTERQYVKPRPYWMRIRSFCVRSPYG